jgi:hypothetical protein
MLFYIMFLFNMHSKFDEKVEFTLLNIKSNLFV